MSRSIKYASLCFVAAIMIFVACKKEPEVEEIIKGCTDITADNYNPNAKESDGSCTYQKRFVGPYDIKVLCDQSSDIFTDATMILKATSNPKKVEFIISTSSTDINFFGDIIHKDTVRVDTLIPKFKADIKNIIKTLPVSQIVTVDLGIKSKFALSADIKKLAGKMDLVLISRDTVIYIGTKVPPVTIPDKCELNATKK
jgi:hypothetical protein